MTMFISPFVCDVLSSDEFMGLMNEEWIGLSFRELRNDVHEDSLLRELFKLGRFIESGFDDAGYRIQ